MARRKENLRSDLFEDSPVDPMTAATGSPARQHNRLTPKRKVGFYISADLLDRFERKFYELKLSGSRIANKSALLEMAIELALEDMDLETAQSPAGPHGLTRRRHHASIPAPDKPAKAPIST